MALSLIYWFDQHWKSHCSAWQLAQIEQNKYICPAGDLFWTKNNTYIFIHVMLYYL